MKRKQQRKNISSTLRESIEEIQTTNPDISGGANIGKIVDNILEGGNISGGSLSEPTNVLIQPTNVQPYSVEPNTSVQPTQRAQSNDMTTPKQKDNEEVILEIFGDIPAGSVTGGAIQQPQHQSQHQPQPPDGDPTTTPPSSPSSNGDVSVDADDDDTTDDDDDTTDGHPHDGSTDTSSSDDDDDDDDASGFSNFIRTYNSTKRAPPTIVDSHPFIL
jgi:hypothetical protein